MSQLPLWEGPNGIYLPNTIKNEEELIPYASNLNDRQRQQIIAAFQIKAYDMASEYAWKKAMVKLKETIATLGMEFIGEMIGRDDFDETTQIDSVLTDFTTIQLAEQLGVIGPTAALKLRQSNELISHYFSKNADEEIDYTTAFGIVKSSVQYILGESDISIALKFSHFRNRLLSETLPITDSQVEQLINSPLFYLRTVMTILLSSIKSDIGAKLEHALANLNTLLPNIWKKLGDNDKWHIGTAYRDVTAAGNTLAASGLKSALLKVGGFDFVPENLRSTTFIKTAQQLLEVHFGHNNFYNEPPVAKKLSQLGSTIPAPALIETMQAYLAVYLGFTHGNSWNAASIAGEQLAKITSDRWFYYFEKVIQNDDIILRKMYPNQVARFSELLNSNGLNKFENLPSKNQRLYAAIVENKGSRAENIAAEIYNELRIKTKS